MGEGDGSVVKRAYCSIEDKILCSSTQGQGTQKLIASNSSSRGSHTHWPSIAHTYMYVHVCTQTHINKT